MATRKAATKEVTVLARYAHKRDGKLTGVVTYAVRSSRSNECYYVTLVEGKATGCNCPSNRPCYHMKGLECKEAGRPFASKSLPVWAMWLIESGVLTLLPSKSTVMTADQDVASTQERAKVIDISTKGNLNGNRGFQLMRA